MLVLIHHFSDQAEISQTFCSNELIELLVTIVMKGGLEAQKLKRMDKILNKEKVGIKGMNCLLYRFNEARGLG